MSVAYYMSLHHIVICTVYRTYGMSRDLHVMLICKAAVEVGNKFKPCMKTGNCHRQPIRDNSGRWRKY
eukprot:scaffold370998_cov18-Prasinocladus_malaysianus.AAC.2